MVSLGVDRLRKLQLHLHRAGGTYENCLSGNEVANFSGNLSRKKGGLQQSPKRFELGILAGENSNSAHHILAALPGLSVART